jgi:hypothetical protein
MKGSVYLYFGDSQLTRGSFEDLQRLGITPEEGLNLNFYDLDADNLDRPTYYVRMELYTAMNMAHGTPM